MTIYTSPNNPCPYCQNNRQTGPTETRCHFCNVQWTHRDAWQSGGKILVALTFYLKDHPQVFSLVMHMQTEMTVVWLRNEHPEVKSRTQFAVPHIYPDTKPEDANHLATKLWNLRVFL